MPTAVIEDWDSFSAFLAAQPFCQWSAQKRRELAMGSQVTRGRSSVHPPPPPKNDNAELAAALSSMA